MLRPRSLGYLGPMAAVLREGALHYLCNGVPPGTLTISEVEGTSVTWKCSHCGERWVVDMGVDVGFDFVTTNDLVAEAEANIPIYALDQINELELMLLRSQ